jgi:photosystem II stability/assembly factor-like uncharacterized protein
MKYLLLVCIILVNTVNAQTDYLKEVSFRGIGPYRGGRSAAVAAGYKDKQVFFMGTTGGGVWKTKDGGSNWKNISDKYFGGSIGAIAIAPSDENIIYVGEGENTMRGNVSEGIKGLWKTDDSGKTWVNMGLKDSRHITRIIVHPKNADIIWVGVMGHLFGPNKERGVYKSIDGGKTFKQVLFVNEITGCSDLVMEPNNPKILYAGMWWVKRAPYSLESGGIGSGLFKSVDGGETWTNISINKGMPKGIWGIVGVAVAPSNTDKLYALIENEKGGLYVSNDAGMHWQLQNSDNSIRQRAWYFSKVFVHPKNENQIWVLSVDLQKSIDGGKSFKSIRTPHSDHHDMFIDPDDGNRMILGDDGGAQISFDNGNNWSTYENQPTAQIYRVSTDNSFPYYILGAQQDNTTIRIRSRTYGNAITDKDWMPTAGSESGYVVADPTNPDIVYGGNYGGYLSRLNHKTGEDRAISVWPDNPIGAGADVQRYRFQWNFPIFFSPHNPKKLYAAANHLFVTEDEGQHWQEISPDLTTNDKTKQAVSGGVITKDNTSVEYYCTIFTATESALEKDLLYTGSDDGLIHVSKDAGKNWKNITPKYAPKFIMWNSVEVDPFKKGTCYIVGTCYKTDDYTPYIYKTENYGETWTIITAGIPTNYFTRVLRADKVVPNLLYAGTEYGLFISYNGGTSWKPFQQNLPQVPITDMTIKNNDLVVATQGRAFWVLDDLTPIQQANAVSKTKAIHVFDIQPAYRMEGQQDKDVVNQGMNARVGAIMNYIIQQPITDSTTCSIQLLDEDRKLIKTFSNKATDDKLKIDIKQGFNSFNWDLNYDEVEKLDSVMLWNGNITGPKAAPGKYVAKLIYNKTDSIEKTFTVVADPNYNVSQEDYKNQFIFLTNVKTTFASIQKTIKDIRSIRSQLNQYISLQGAQYPKEMKLVSDTLFKQLQKIEEALYQTKLKAPQDMLNYPIRLNDKLSGLYYTANSGNMAPSKQVKEVYEVLKKQVDEQLNRFNTLQQQELATYNKMIKEQQAPVIGISK